ncbi:MAG: UDP-N-acetylglucosamine 4,6-dehydratase (inverting) [Elusimicrobia bacterium]|nr:UDP-N-acetylglucosamine 4,6-dehydratase (inverting) [Elusimicrobiota bacterium]
MLKGKVVLVTGGTGSFGKAFISAVLKKHKPRKVVVYSRDELKQFEMRRLFDEKTCPEIRYFIGDVRDRDRLYRAFDGVDVVIHAAALKQVPAAEYNPLEAIKTNVLGAANVIDAAIDRNVKTVVALSTDKAVNPVNLYGATKLCSDKLFVSANNYAGAHGTRFSVVRYGNVVGSRGSVIPFFLRAVKTGVLPITDERMTRFWITLDQAVAFVMRSIQMMEGGDIFVPKIPSMNIMDLAKAVAPNCRTKIVGIRPGEKLHEVMVTEDDARDTVEFPDRYVILPAEHGWDGNLGKKMRTGKPCPAAFRYSSDGNKDWLTVEQLRSMIRGLKLEDPVV